MKAILASFAVLVMAGFMAGGCTTAPKGEEAKADLHADATAALNRIQRVDAGVQKHIDGAYGYAIFPGVGKGGVIAGGAYGRGEVYEQGKFIGFSDLSQATIGFQLGGQKFIELILFQNKKALDDFIAEKFAFSANASAVALKAGASAAVDYQNGVAVFTVPLGGAMFEASVGGQKFTFQPSPDRPTTRP